MIGIVEMAGGFDISQYDPFTQVITTVVAQADTYETAYTVSNKGFMTVCVCIGDENHAEMKITIDGVLKFDGLAGTNGCGITLFSNLLGDNNNPQEMNHVVFDNLQVPLYVEGQALKNYPYVGADHAVIITDFPIFFNTSLLVEVKSTTIGHTVKTHIRGGLHK